MDNRNAGMERYMENSRMSLAERELEIPVSEPERQYYFIDRARKDLEKMKEAAGRQLTFCVTTFGCPKYD